MAGSNNELEKWATDVIFGRARGFWPAMMRLGLRGLSWIYRFGVRLRLRLYRKGWKPQTNLGTMVVSIGNLTVGGTGKTPVVERFARELAALPLLSFPIIINGSLNPSGERVEFLG